jgi:hypothetical protein
MNHGGRRTIPKGMRLVGVKRKVHAANGFVTLCGIEFGNYLIPSNRVPTCARCRNSLGYKQP